MKRLICWTTLTVITLISITTLSCLFWQLFRAKTQTEKVAAIVKLPPQAVVTWVLEDDWQLGDGQVKFNLPKNNPPGKWMHIVWDMNPRRPGCKPTTISHDKVNIEFSTEDGAQVHESLSYDLSDGSYHYYISTFDN